MTSFMTLTPFGGIEAEVRLACISLFTAGGRVWDAESGGSSAQPRAQALFPGHTLSFAISASLPLSHHPIPCASLGRQGHHPVDTEDPEAQRGTMISIKSRSTSVTPTWLDIQVGVIKRMLGVRRSGFWSQLWD